MTVSGSERDPSHNAIIESEVARVLFPLCVCTRMCVCVRVRACVCMCVHACVSVCVNIQNLRDFLSSSDWYDLKSSSIVLNSGRSFLISQRTHKYMHTLNQYDV